MVLSGYQLVRLGRWKNI